MTEQEAAAISAQQEALTIALLCVAQAFSDLGAGAVLAEKLRTNAIHLFEGGSDEGAALLMQIASLAAPGPDHNFA